MSDSNSEIIELILYAGDNGYGVVFEPTPDQWTVSFMRGPTGGIDEVTDSVLTTACRIAQQRLEQRLNSEA